MGDRRAAQADLMRRQRAAEREVVIPRVVNPRRKKRCEKDLIRFVESYFREPPDAEKYPGRRGLACLPLSPLHREILKELQLRILYGGQQALAAPRGFGKDTLAIMATIWATFYGHSRFIVFACFESDEAQNRVEMVKGEIEINKWLMEDFPEVCAPIVALERAAQRAKQQTYNGEYTRLEWGRTIVLPNIPGSKASGCIVSAGSLSGSIRGLLKNGMRPSFVIISDPQTDEVAKSQTQKEDVLRRIRQDFGGLGAMDRPLSCLALVTIIKRHDVADQLTNIEDNPQWSGRKFGAIVRWPERMDLWDQYESLLEKGKRSGDPTGREAHVFYVQHRGEMDAGAQVSWEDAYIPSAAPDGSPLEISALQHFMNIRWRIGEDAFVTEYQNEPPEEEGATAITPAIVASRLSTYPVFIVPPEHGKLIQFIDVGGTEIHYGVLATADDATGSFVDYGRVKVDAPEGNLADPSGEVRRALELQVLKALRQRREMALGPLSPYRTVDGRQAEIYLSLVDSGWLERVVYFFCRESGPRWIATKGEQAQSGNRRFTMPGKRAPWLRLGDNWYARRQESGQWLYHLNADHWKMEVQRRFMQTPGTQGALTLYGSDPREHRTFSKHVCAEEWDMEMNKFVKLSRWNHFLDVAAGCVAGARISGARLLAKGDGAGRGKEYTEKWKRLFR